MSSNRKADLQRKLSLNAVPRPPADLADRIKADIPKYLEVDPERSRFSRSIAFNMRIAASLLVLITALVTTVYLVSPESEKVMTATPGTAIFAPAKRAIQQAEGGATEEVNLDVSEESLRPQMAAAPAAAPPPALSSTLLEELAVAPVAVASAESVALERDEAGPAAAEPQQVADFAPQSANENWRNRAAGREAPPAPAAAAREEASQDAVQERVTVTAAAPSLSIVPEARAASRQPDEPRDQLFGISVDPAAFQRVRRLLENGRRPNPSDVDIEALVNYFAAAAGNAPAPRDGLRLEVEASPAAIGAEGDHAIVRFTVDTAHGDRLPGGSASPVAADARLEVEFNKAVVKSARRIGGNEAMPAQSVLLAGTSVTGLYAIELRPNLTSKENLAVVRLRYKAVPQGHRQNLTRTVRAGDLAKGWSRATRRHRLASLGAVWGETLKGTALGRDAVAERAEELATQKPDDPLARELASAASASAGGW